LAGKTLLVLEYKYHVHQLECFLPFMARPRYLSSSADSDESKQASSAAAPASNISESAGQSLSSTQSVGSSASSAPTTASAVNDATKTGSASDKPSMPTSSKSTVNEIVIKGEAPFLFYAPWFPIMVM
jgi:hypothetical protein